MAPKRAKKRASSAAPTSPPKRALHYKVVELSNVDEHSLERTINEWSPRGWSFDGVQFAMRESSKRPSMAFVFFTREGGAIPEPVEHPDAFRHESEADAHLKRLAHARPAAPQPKSTDAWSRLQALAGDDEAGDV
jgi:hypothetical protein